MRRRAARGPAAGVILLLAGVIALAAGCVAGEPGGMAALPAATDLPTATPMPAATELPAATPLPTATDLPTLTASPTAAPIVVARTDEPTPIYGMIRLAAALDGPQHYCIDVPGHSGGVRLDAPLQAHTCKPGADDQTFQIALGYYEYSELRMPAYERDSGRCLAVTDSDDRPVIAAACHSRDENRFWVDRIRREGRLSVKAKAFRERCIEVAGGGEPAGGRNHLRRDLRVYDCAAADLSLITWIFREEGAHIN